MPARHGEGAWVSLADPFTLGVASGDPTADGIVLWTRLVPDPARGPMPDHGVGVRWEVARDDGFRQIVRRGNALATPELAHSVHVEVDGLEPARDYWYRFHAGGATSPGARTRTAPAPAARTDRVRFAFVSCQNYAEGFYTAYRHLADEDAELVVHLGDYIYEYGLVPGTVRPHEGTEIITLAQYRDRYALYKRDADLQAAHARLPFVVTWDDHEVDNNYASAFAEDSASEATLLTRRAAAYQAYYEHMPVRRSALPRGPNARLFRTIPYGDLAAFTMLDTRQYRSDQPCGDGRKARCAEALAPARTMIGAEQERWLLDTLGASRARWNVLGNQVPFGQIDAEPGPDATYPLDKWDGYVASRQRVLDFLRSRHPSNPVFITGDVHSSMAMDIKANFDDPSSETLAVEFIGTSISSGGDGSDLPALGARVVQSNPHMKFFSGQRGYVRCTLTPDRWTSEYRVVPLVTRPGAPVSTRATFVVENGRAGVEKA